jgi:hypothetical protein
MFCMKHHFASEHNLILHQLGWQDQPQSDTLRNVSSIMRQLWTEFNV